MPAPRWLARFNLHVTNRLLGPLARHLPGMGVVLHTGRASGRRYRTPVMIFPRGNNIFVALTYGRDSEWVRNVVARGGCQLETQGRMIRLVDPHIIRDENRALVPALHRTILGWLNVSDFLELTRAEFLPAQHAA
jgi:deazaflavin-dependent oxidoreductase (nitroreductase family)